MLYNNLIILFFITIIHYVLLNGLEKIFFSHTSIPISYLIRPSDCCITQDEYIVGCFGMPSGHAEIISIITYILYKYKYISWVVMILCILIVCFQRIIFKKHTIIQVIVGTMLGLIYGTLYFKTKLSFLSLYTTIFLIFIFTFLTFFIIDYKIKNTEIPSWVDKNMHNKIKEKQNANSLIKLYSIITPSYEQNQNPFVNWNLIEKYLDNIILEIKKSNIEYHGVVGIKSGGAIISDYISKKLNLPNYKIKVSTVDNKCNKRSINTFYTFIDLYIRKINKKYMLCEGINENISNQNLILIDESVSSGGTIKKSIDYLLDEKNVSKIFACSIYTNDKLEYRNTLLHSQKITNHIPLIWNWGYDN